MAGTSCNLLVVPNPAIKQNTHFALQNYVKFEKRRWHVCLIPIKIADFFVRAENIGSDVFQNPSKERKHRSWHSPLHPPTLGIRRSSDHDSTSTNVNMNDVKGLYTKMELPIIPLSKHNLLE